MPTAPYGSWPSPVDAALMTTATVGLQSPALDGETLYWLESRPDQGGRVGLWRRTAAGAVAEVTPAPFNVRTRVHEYGGGEYGVDDGVVVFSHDADGRLYRVDPGGAPTPLTEPGPFRYADLVVSAADGRVFAVREDHSGPGEPENTVVVLDLAGGGPGRVVCGGADFYSTPRPSPDGRLAWVEWDHPNMPWDSTRVVVAGFDGSAVTGAGTVAGGPEESAVQPRWTPDGDLVFVSDRTDWWNLYRWRAGEVEPLHPGEKEFAGPQWQLGQSPYAVEDADHLVCTWSRNGAGAIGRLTLSTGELTPIAEPGVHTGSVAVGGGRVAAVLRSEDRPPRLALTGAGEDGWTEVRRSSTVEVDPGLVAAAQPVSWSSPRGPVYGWYYPPTSPGFTGPDGERPPMITSTHGGPTAFSPAEFRLGTLFWTSRGVAVLVVNYGGSTGYGRAYRNRLRGTWGLVDVEDCVAGATAMAEQGLADPRRLAICGGSAGGYTTLRALTVSDVFSAGLSSYGVGDLEALAADTHKFESRYLDGLVGPYPEAAEVYRDRSPVHHVDRLSAPILLLQGSEDRVVPPNQAEAMAAAARAKGLPVALLVFAGEGHGFRRAETITAAVEAELYFLGRVFGFVPADELPAIPIDNLPS